MKVKRLITMITALIMTVSCAQGASAERIKFIEPVVSSEEGVTTVTYTLTEMPVGEDATLIAAYIEPESGNILSVNSQSCEDVSLLEEGKISLTLADKSAEGGELKHYLWKNLNEVISLNDIAPNPVANVTALPDVATPWSKVNISWEAPEDDWDSADDINYNIYDMGLLWDGNVSGTEYSAENLKWGNRYSFEVEAVDTTGNTTEKSSGKATETIIPYSIITTDKVSSTDGNLIFTSNAYEEESPENGAKWFYCYTNETVDNLPCVATTLRRGAGTYHSVKLSEDFMNEVKDERDFVFEVEYASASNTRLKVEIYETANGAETAENKIFNINNDGKWHVLTGKMTLRYGLQVEGRKGHNNSHFRFIGGSSSAEAKVPLYIRRVTFMTLDQYNALNPERDAYLDVQEGIVTNGLTFDGEPSVQKIGDSCCVEADGLSVTAESNVNTSDATGIEVIYYAPEGTESFTINGVRTEVTQSGTWQKARVPLESGLAGGSFVVNGEVYINHIRLLNSLPAIS